MQVKIGAVKRIIFWSESVSGWMGERTTKSAMNVMTAQLYNITTPTFIRLNLQPDCP